MSSTKILIKNPSYKFLREKKYYVYAVQVVHHSDKYSSDQILISEAVRK